jgi:hypothetical protein
MPEMKKRTLAIYISGKKRWLMDDGTTSRWTSHLLAPSPEPLCRWYPGGVPSKHTEMDGLMQERSYDSDTTSDEHRERTCSFLRGAGEEGERDALRRRAGQPGTERAGGGQQEQ